MRRYPFGSKLANSIGNGKQPGLKRLRRITGEDIGKIARGVRMKNWC